MPALPQDNQKRYADKRLERRHEHAPGADQLDVARDILAVGLVKAANFGFFLCVGANDAHSGKIFLHLRGQRRERSLNFFVQLVNHFAEMLHDYGDDRYRKQNPKRE